MTESREEESSGRTKSREEESSGKRTTLPSVPTSRTKRRFPARADASRSREASTTPSANCLSVTPAPVSGRGYSLCHNSSLVTRFTVGRLFLPRVNSRFTVGRLFCPRVRFLCLSPALRHWKHGAGLVNFPFHCWSFLLGSGWWWRASLHTVPGYPAPIQLCSPLPPTGSWVDLPRLVCRHPYSLGGDERERHSWARTTD